MNENEGYYGIQTHRLNTATELVPHYCIYFIIQVIWLIVYWLKIYLVLQFEFEFIIQYKSSFLYFGGYVQLGVKMFI